MTRLDGPKYAPFYDLFKLIVAVILAVILIALLLRHRQGLPMQPPATLTRSIAMATIALSPSVTSAPATSLPIASATATSTPTTQPTAALATATLLPTATSTPETQPPIASAPAAPNPPPTSTQSAPTSDPNACPSAPTRIQQGDKVRVLYRLNFRLGPGLSSPILLTNGIGILMDVIGGPVCIPRNTAEGSRAHLWWNVRMEDSREGWSAEAPLILTYYFLEPVR